MNIRSYILGEEILLYSEPSKSIYRLNPSAGFIWCCYEEGMPEDQIASELAKFFAIEQSKAQTDVNKAFEEWRESGLLDKEPLHKDLIQGETDLTNPPAHQDKISWDQIKQIDYFEERWFEIFDQTMCIRFSDGDLSSSARKAIGSLEIAVGNGQPDHFFTVAKVSNDYAIYSEDLFLASCENENEVAPLLLAHLISTIYLDTNCLMGMHAAAVGLNNEYIILPAMSGSGKSTLTAALVGSGFDYYTDELVLITQDSHRLITAHTGIALKPGSWPILKNFYPALASLTTHHRQDGKQVRYLLPSDISKCKKVGTTHVIRALVFPTYRSGQPVSVSPITTADALCRLAEAGYDVKGGLDRNRVEELIGWIGKQNCYELLFDNLNNAIVEIRSLIS